MTGCSIEKSCLAVERPMNSGRRWSGGRFDDDTADGKNKNGAPKILTNKSGKWKARMPKLVLQPAHYRSRLHIYVYTHIYIYWELDRFPIDFLGGGGDAISAPSLWRDAITTLELFFSVRDSPMRNPDYGQGSLTIQLWPFRLRRAHATSLGPNTPSHNKSDCKYIFPIVVAFLSCLYSAKAGGKGGEEEEEEEDALQLYDFLMLVD